jgi:voltage-gated potassium channel
MSLQDLAPAKRRRLIAVGLLRALVATALLVVAYYLLPFRNVSDAKSVVLLVVGMLAVILIVMWEVRAILKAAYPGLQAVEALAIAAPLFLLLFASAYYLIEQATPGSFSQPLSRTDALYFTVTTFSTVGYGDITAKSEGARVMVIFQMLADLIILGVGLKVIFGAVQMVRQRQPSVPAHGSSAPDSSVPA